MDKKCSICEQIKPMEDFYDHPKAADKKQSHCKICHNKISQKYYRRKDVQEKRNAYFKTPEGKKYRDEHNEKYRSENPEKVRAHVAVAQAIRSHKIPKVCDLLCECGQPAEHYHHNDYLKPLEVIPVCHRCHENIHHNDQSNS